MQPCEQPYVLESVLTFGLDLPIKVLWFASAPDPPDPDPKILSKNLDPRENWGFGMRIREAKKYGTGQLILLHRNGKQKFTILFSLFEKLRDARDKTLVCKNRKPKKIA